MTSLGTPLAADQEAYVAILKSRPRTTRYEVGINAERLLRPDLVGKAIGIFRQEKQTPTSSLLVTDPEENLLSFRESNTNRVTTEAIGRAEFSWEAWSDHLIQVNLEVAYNSLDNKVNQQVDFGDGSGLQQQSLPNANTLVEEVRGDVLVRDIWTLGQFDVHYGLGVELSRIRQSGDANLERSFVFLKPEGLISYSASPRLQTRLRVAREVAQLNFEDFVTATFFEDEGLLEGNPDLEPESTWIAELSQEQRFAGGSAVTLTLFHHWISDVEDLLALPNEVPGNIGNGRRWGIKAQATFPLDQLGLTDARLDFRGRWQDSSVRDPVTGRRRNLSGIRGDSGSIPFRDEDNAYAVNIEFRQDFQAARVAWGFGAVRRAERTLFKLDELDVFNEGTQLSAFIETTRWLGIKMRLEGDNLLDFDRTRDRTVYVGARDLSDVELREKRSRTRGVRIYLKLSGNF
ncbi:MAG: TonB-dependent receptor [Gammaproteobacteria bacterium]|nr:MAG: TonB-dependent receptor [Gammaproteobacteria bacterium]